MKKKSVNYYVKRKGYVCIKIWTKTEENHYIVMIILIVKETIWIKKIIGWTSLCKEKELFSKLSKKRWRKRRTSMTGRPVNVYQHSNRQLICKAYRWKIVTHLYAREYMWKWQAEARLMSNVDVWLHLAVLDMHFYRWWWTEKLHAFSNCDSNRINKKNLV